MRGETQKEIDKDMSTCIYITGKIDNLNKCQSIYNNECSCIDSLMNLLPYTMYCIKDSIAPTHSLLDSQHLTLKASQWYINHATNIKGGKGPIQSPELAPLLTIIVSLGLSIIRQVIPAPTEPSYDKITMICLTVFVWYAKKGHLF